MRHPKPRRIFRIRPIVRFLAAAIRVINEDTTQPPLAYVRLAAVVDYWDSRVTAAYRRLFGN